MASKWKFYYGTAAIGAAVIVIAAALLGAPMVNNQFAGQSQFLILLTDPPNVPENTTCLNLTYSDIVLHITHSDKTASWLPVEAKGTVNLLTLINMSQTLASVTLPADSTVDKIQFNIADVTATVNDVSYSVTTMSDTIVLNAQNGKFGNGLSGLLVDFNPTLVETQSVDGAGDIVISYVLVPSANARIICGLSGEQSKVGAVVGLRQQDIEELSMGEEEFAHAVTITAASLFVKGNDTELSVTIKNQGTDGFTMFGLLLQGEFDSAKTATEVSRQSAGNNGNKSYSNTHKMNSSRAVPFKIDEQALNPIFAANNSESKYAADLLTLRAGGEVTLMFKGALQIQSSINSPLNVITPVIGSVYTLRLMGEGYQTFEVEAMKMQVI